MANATVSAPVRPRGSWHRYLWIGLALLAAVAIGVLFLRPTLRIDWWIKDLGTSNPKQLEASRAELRASTHPQTDELLAAAVADGGRPFLARERAADLLLIRSRLGAVENLARSDDLMTRAVALRILGKRVPDQFLRDYLPDPAYRVKETVAAWLADPRLESRSDAVSLAIFISLPDAMAKVRPLLSRAQVEKSGASDAKETLLAAVSAAEKFQDCASVPAIAALADGDMDWEVRRGSLEALEALVVGRLGSVPPCPTAEGADKVPEIIRRTLDGSGPPDFVRNLRIKGLILIGRHPEWLPANAKRVWEVLRGGEDGVARREALSTLVKGKDPEIAAEFPRYLHDRNQWVRSTAVDVAAEVPGLAPESLWIGILRSEPDNLHAVLEAHAALKRAAGKTVGLPKVLESLRLQPTEQKKEIQRFLEELMRQGSSMGTDRETWADAWFRWYAEKLGLTPEGIEKAVAARKKFQTAVDRMKVADARAALAEVPDAPAPLFLYEQAWLLGRSE